MPASVNDWQKACLLLFYQLFNRSVHITSTFFSFTLTLLMTFRHERFHLTSGIKVLIPQIKATFSDFHSSLIDYHIVNISLVVIKDFSFPFFSQIQKAFVKSRCCRLRICVNLRRSHFAVKCRTIVELMFIPSPNLLHVKSHHYIVCANNVDGGKSFHLHAAHMRESNRLHESRNGIRVTGMKYLSRVLSN